MSESNSPYGFHFSRITVLLILLVLCACDAQAQEPTADGRIVEGRPPLYSFKRNIHPLTWVEWGARPIVRSAESGWIHKLAMRRPSSDKTAGVKLSLDGDGAGSGFGPAVTFFHRDLFGRGIDVEVPLLHTYNHYELYQFNASVPVVRGTFVKRLSVDIGTAYRSRSRDDIFPIGNEAALGTKSHIRTVSREAAIGFSAHVNDQWKAGLRETYRNIGVTAPYRGSSAQDRLKAFPIPGLSTGAMLRSTVLTLEHDTKDRERMAAKGGRERAEISLTDSAGKGDFAYWKYRLDFQRFFTLISDGRTVAALRGSAETNQKKGGSNVPWFDMPALGTWDTLRGFENFRFRDKSALSFSAEYRYRIWRAMDWAFFLDEGQVAPQPGDFGWNRFHAGYGFRLFMFPKTTFPVAVDVAHSNEKIWRLYVNFNATF